MADLCEWNPVTHNAATSPPAPGDCPNEASVCVGSGISWHLCESCAELPEFSKYRRREPLRTGVNGGASQ